MKTGPGPSWMIVLLAAAALVSACGTGIPEKGTPDDHTGRLGHLLAARPAVRLSAAPPPNSDHPLSPAEAELARLVNRFRSERGLPAVPVSKSLTAVARRHVWDLEQNDPAAGKCNLHSWSNARPDLWNPVCYTPDHANAKEMWEKPAQITGGEYSGRGYENVFMDPAGATAEAALAAWKENRSHRRVMAEKGIWKKTRWRAMGVAVRGAYAAIWFGRRPDPAGTLSAGAPLTPRQIAERPTKAPPKYWTHSTETRPEIVSLRLLCIPTAR